MRVLLDEDLPHKLRTALVEHETMTVSYLGWKGMKDGALLDLASSAGFEVVLTADQSLQHQQNLSGRSFSVVILSSQYWPVLVHHVEAISAAVRDSVAGHVSFVSCISTKKKALRIIRRAE